MARILVVDDEPDLCEILCFNLESEGFEAERAYSAEAALQMLEQGASFDLILLDVMMERMSGIDMARHLRSTGVDIPIIFLTARTAEDDQLDGFAAGGDDYVTKPFSFPTVLARIRAVLKRASTTSNNDMLSFGQLTVDVKSKTVAIDGVQVSLTISLSYSCKIRDSISRVSRLWIVCGMMTPSWATVRWMSMSRDCARSWAPAVNIL